MNTPHIFTIRGLRVMLDFQLAALYGMETRTLNQAVKRNIERFDGDFMFQLTFNELTDTRSQIVTTPDLSSLNYVAQSLPYGLHRTRHRDALERTALS